MSALLGTQYSEIREDNRASATKQGFEGALVEPDTGVEHAIRPLDVSLRGLGFLSMNDLAPGIYELRCRDRVISVEVVYCSSHLGIENLYRCGLYARDADLNLKEIFSDLQPRPGDF